MSTRKEMITEFYDRSDENGRLEKSRHGQLEYAITMAYIHRFLNPGARVLEVGAGTGRYSIALAKEGFDVTAVEFVESNLAALRENSCGLDLIRSYQGDATDLCLFDDDSFDMTLVLGPMYHLFAPEDVNRAIDEAGHEAGRHAPFRVSFDIRPYVLQCPLRQLGALSGRKLHEGFQGKALSGTAVHRLRCMRV